MDTLTLAALLKASRLSPEDLGERIGVSGMSIRRWIEKPNSQPLPVIYQNAIRDAVYKLVVDGQLDSDCKVAQKVFAHAGNLPQQAALKALGFPEDFNGDFESQQEQITQGLSQIGSLASRRQKVDENQAKLPTYKKLGREWSERISVLSDILRSKKLTVIEKFPAYGAFFYLFMTFDLIPDSIPVFGLMDDFAILGIACTYYVNRQIKVGQIT